MSEKPLRELRKDAVKAMLAVVERGEPFLSSDLAKAANEAGLAQFRCPLLANKITQDLKRAGEIVIVGNRATAYVWRKRPPPPAVVASPALQGPYDAPAKLEGPNNGLTEALAEFLWHDLGAADRSRTLRENTAPMEARAWREAADRTLNFLFARGMVGPGGAPSHPPGPGWTYAWVYEANNWEIVDQDGGGVALVLNDADVPMMLAAPRMAEAIKAMLGRFEEVGGVKRSDLDKLRESLPVEKAGE